MALYCKFTSLAQWNCFPAHDKLSTHTASLISRVARLSLSSCDGIETGKCAGTISVFCLPMFLLCASACHAYVFECLRCSCMPPCCLCTATLHFMHRGISTSAWQGYLGSIMACYCFEQSHLHCVREEFNVICSVQGCSWRVGCDNHRAGQSASCWNWTCISGIDRWGKPFASGIQ